MVLSNKFVNIWLPKWVFLHGLVTLSKSKQVTHQKPFNIWHFPPQTRSNWHKIQIFTSISYNLTPRLRKLVILEVLSSKKRFSTASSKFPSASFVGHQKLPEIGSKIRQVSYFKQILLIQNFLIYTWFQTFY